MTDLRTPAEHAASIRAARDRLIEFVLACPDEVWRARPLAGQGDRRPTGVIADHIAFAYEYMGGFIGQLLSGVDPQVDVAMIDRLNAEHALLAAGITQQAVAEHLTTSGNELIAQVAALTEAELAAAGGKVRRLAEISARHPDTHRTELEDAIAAQSLSIFREGNDNHVASRAR